MKETATEKRERLRWQAEDDARTMATYAEIMNDPSRRNRAVKAAKSEAARLQNKVDTMKKVIKGGNKNVTTRK